MAVHDDLAMSKYRREYSDKLKNLRTKWGKIKITDMIITEMLNGEKTFYPESLLSTVGHENILKRIDDLSDKIIDLNQLLEQLESNLRKILSNIRQEPGDANITSFIAALTTQLQTQGCNISEEYKTKFNGILENIKQRVRWSGYS